MVCSLENCSESFWSCNFGVIWLDKQPIVTRTFYKKLSRQAQMLLLLSHISWWCKANPLRGQRMRWMTEQEIGKEMEAGYPPYQATEQCPDDKFLWFSLLWFLNKSSLLMVSLLWRRDSKLVAKRPLLVCCLFYWAVQIGSFHYKAPSLNLAKLQRTAVFRLHSTLIEKLTRAGFAFNWADGF